MKTAADEQSYIQEVMEEIMAEENQKMHRLLTKIKRIEISKLLS